MELFRSRLAVLKAWVFCNEHGGLLHPHNLRDRIFYGLLKKAGIRQVGSMTCDTASRPCSFSRGKAPCM